MSIRFASYLFIALIVLSPGAGWAQQRSLQPGAQSSPVGADLDQMMQFERQDLGVAVPKQLHSGPMHAPTPTSIPGGQVITTKGLIALVQGRQTPYLLFDVLGGPESLPNAVPAVWTAQPGSFDDAIQQQLNLMLEQYSRGRKDMPLVFYCQSRECWMSYNAAFRAVRAGYTNVLWYRGGLEAWKAAGLPTQGGQHGLAGPSQGQSQAQSQSQLPPIDPRSQFVPVNPLPLGADSGNGSASVVSRSPGLGAPVTAGELRIGQGRFFSFALPPGWRLGEDGQFALTLVAPDERAMTIMVGNAGMPLNFAPGRYAFERLSALQPQNLQIGDARQARPAAGFTQAAEFEVSYVARGIPFRGIAKVSVAPAYDSATMAMTAAVSSAEQWRSYGSWLPQVADQVSALNGAAFGRRGIMQQNLQNSVAFGEAARQYRDWSQKNWQSVTDQRNASQDQQNFAFRENLGGVQTFANPYGSGPPKELPLTHKYYWSDRQGQIVGTNDPSANPNFGSTNEWRKMERVVR